MTVDMNNEARPAFEEMEATRGPWGFLDLE